MLWGGSYPLLKVAVETIPPLTVVAVRALVGGLILLAVLGRRADLLWEMRKGPAARQMLVQSAFTCIIPWLLIAWAVRQIDAGLATILNSLSPIFIFLLTALVTRHEPATGRKFVGVVLGIAGVLVIVGVDAISGAGSKILAELACVAGAFSYAVAGVLGVRFAKVTPLVPAAGTTLVAAVVLLPIAIAVEQPWTAQPSTRSVAALLAAAAFSTGLAMVIYYRLLGTVGSITMSAQAYLRILVGVGLSMAFLGERPTPHALAGLFLVVLGVLAMTLPGGAAEACGGRNAAALAAALRSSSRQSPSGSAAKTAPASARTRCQSPRATSRLELAARPAGMAREDTDVACGKVAREDLDDRLAAPGEVHAVEQLDHVLGRILGAEDHDAAPRRPPARRRTRPPAREPVRRLRQRACHRDAGRCD